MLKPIKRDAYHLCTSRIFFHSIVRHVASSTKQKNKKFEILIVHEPEQILNKFPLLTAQRSKLWGFFFVFLNSSLNMEVLE